MRRFAASCHMWYIVVLGLLLCSHASCRVLKQETTEEHPEDQFDAAPSCRAVPTATTSTPDSIGRLWGWHHETSCAFKDVAGHVLFYTEYTPASWLRTPACAAAPFPDDSVADAKFKVWGWTGEGRQKTLCAFKNDRQQPIPIDRHLYKLTWVETPACIEEALPTSNSSVPDEQGCLYGWQLDRNCAYKTEANEPLYYNGYNRTCNTTADLEPTAADNTGYTDGFDIAEGYSNTPAPSDQTKEGEEGHDAPGAVTSVGRIRQKAHEKERTQSEVNVLFFNKNTSADLNKAIKLSSDEGTDGFQSTNTTLLASDTTVPVMFDNGTNTLPAPVQNQPSLNATFRAQDVSMTSPELAVDLAQNCTDNGAVICDTPVPVAFDEPTAPASNSASAPAQRRRLYGSASKPKGNSQGMTKQTLLSPAPTKAAATAGFVVSVPAAITGAAKQVATKLKPSLPLDDGQDQRPSDWTDGGPGGLAPPRHSSRSTVQKTPLLPERAETTFGLAETQTVVYKPVSESVIPEPTWDDGPGGISLPHPRSTAGQRIRLAAIKPISFSAAEAPSSMLEAAAVMVAGPGFDQAALQNMIPVPTSIPEPTKSTSAPLSHDKKVITQPIFSRTVRINITAGALPKALPKTLPKALPKALPRRLLFTNAVRQITGWLSL